MATVLYHNSFFSRANKFLTGRAAARQDGQRVGGPAHSGGEAGHRGRGGADLPQQAADPLSRLLPQAADAQRGLLEEVGHRGGPAPRRPAVQVGVVDVDGEQDGVQT